MSLISRVTNKVESPLSLSLLAEGEGGEGGREGGRERGGREGAERKRKSNY